VGLFVVLHYWHCYTVTCISATTLLPLHLPLHPLLLLLQDQLGPGSQDGSRLCPN
jgi:hypothetical protein